jgi:hypothetical protein
MRCGVGGAVAPWGGTEWSSAPQSAQPVSSAAGSAAEGALTRINSPVFGFSSVLTENMMM